MELGNYLDSATLLLVAAELFFQMVEMLDLRCILLPGAGMSSLVDVFVHGHLERLEPALLGMRETTSLLLVGLGFLLAHGSRT